MRALIWIAPIIPALVAGMTVGRLAASLDAPQPVPSLVALIVTIGAADFLDRLITTLHAHHTARR